MSKDKREKKQVNLPDARLPHEALTVENLHSSFRDRLDDVYAELAQAFELLTTVEKSVTFFGSARFAENNVHYKQARRLASRISDENFSIITGGGPGIMEAANRGAQDVAGRSIGLTIELPNEQNINPYVTEKLGFHYFFTRKVALAFAAEAYLFFPGGFGTLDEFFEILTLVQTGKVQKRAIILVGSDYWNSVDNLIQEEVYKKHKSVDERDMDLYTITDDENEIVEIVKNAPSLSE